MLGKTIDAAYGVYESGFADASEFSFFSSQIRVWANYLATNGLDVQLAKAIPACAATGVITFNSGAQSYSQSAVQSYTGFNLSLDFYRMTSLAQPTVPQTQAINSGSALQTFHYNHASWTSLASRALGGGTGGAGGTAIRGYSAAAEPKVTEAQALVAGAAGAVSVGAGAALIAASGTTLSVAGCTLTAGVVFTAGAALVVIGAGIALYYGWNFIKSRS